MPLYGVLFQRGSVLNHNSVNGKSRFVGRNMKMHMVSWMDMQDDVYFVATMATRFVKSGLYKEWSLQMLRP